MTQHVSKPPRWNDRLAWTRSPIASGSLALLCAVCFIATGAISADKTTADIEATRTALEKWVENQRIISKEKRDLALSKEMLNERIGLIQREIDSLREKIGDAKKSIEETDKKKGELIEQNDKLKQASSSLESTLVSLEDRTKDLLKRLPAPIRERVKPLSQRLPDGSEEKKASIAERFQNVVGILNEVDKFNLDITVNSEVRDVEDGGSVEVTALYIGVSQGYYVSANGKYAGVGASSDDGWAWKPSNDAAPAIADAIAILKNEKVASFVQLPIEIK
ncbi:MAG: DUF3450 family protein [bacterium]|nr:DUF3450 family protein [bacterium]